MRRILKNGYLIVVILILILSVYAEKIYPGDEKSVTKEKNKTLKKVKLAKKEDDDLAGGFVFVKGGCFKMGDIFGDRGGDEKPVHDVCVDDFYMGKYEVTQGQWKSMMGDNPSGFKDCESNCPVGNVSWNDIQDFIRKLNQKTGKNYCLPTEAEWEYAARSGGKKEKFAGFSNESELYKYANFCDINCDQDWKAKDQNDGYKNISPVGSYRPNGLGLYDMGGNVWEWVQDWFDGNYYKNSPRDNPKGPGKGQHKVMRGGSWFDPPRNIRSSMRLKFEHERRFGDVGFRLAISAK